MTKRVTVSLPDDVAAYLETSDNASATVAEALRAQMNRAATAESMLRGLGFEVTAEGRERARRSLSRLDDATRAEIAERYRQLRAGTWKDDATR